MPVCKRSLVSFEANQGDTLTLKRKSIAPSTQHPPMSVPVYSFLAWYLFNLLFHSKRLMNSMEHMEYHHRKIKDISFLKLHLKLT